MKHTIKKAIIIIKEKASKDATLQEIITALRAKGFSDEIIKKAITRDLMEID